MGECLYFPDRPAEVDSRAGEGASLAALRGRIDGYLSWLRKEAAGLTGLRGLLLGGGYGRGEGGVWWPAGEAAPELYNDMEFYLFAAGVAPGVVDKWIHEGEARLGIEMEFKVMAPEAFAGARPSMFYYDLLKGHVRVAGSAEWVAGLPGQLSEAAQIPVEEGSRLLVNRGMSLFRCLRWSAGEGEGEGVFCDRIAAKLRMALGDAVLCLNGRYTVSCRERNARLSEVRRTPPDWPVIREGHAEGVVFKFRPSASGRSAADWQGPLRELQAIWLRTFLWLEGERLGTTFADARAYTAYSGRLFPEEAAWKNVLRQVRDLRRPVRLPFSGGEHPRARVWRAMAFLMAGDAAGAQAQLGVRLEGAALEEACRAAWKHYP
ncbi:MAG: hypothetical protein JJT96_08990 [Opitutales bacterium]|nr:hypothetical protein [Opitutales bacterium]